MKIRLQGATRDLHAADAVYHVDCRCAFVSKRNIKAAKITNKSSKNDPALEHVIDVIKK